MLLCPSCVTLICAPSTVCHLLLGSQIFSVLRHTPSLRPRPAFLKLPLYEFLTLSLQNFGIFLDFSPASREGKWRTAPMP